MKRSTAKILSLILSLILTICIFPFSVVADNDTPTDFCGTRKIVFIADGSDVENFISGGRSALELALRKNAPNWLDFDVSGDTRDVSITLSFNFSSFSSYKKKTALLLTYEPIIFYSDFMGITLVERHDVHELLGFISQALDTESSNSEKNLSEIFTVNSNVISFGSEEISIGSPTNIRPDDAAVNIYEKLNIHTFANENGSFSRRITASVAAQHSTVKDNFKEYGKFIEGENGEFSVEFSAKSFEDLINTTKNAIKGIVVGESKTVYNGKGEYSIGFNESFDLEGILAKDGSFSYAFVCPDSSTSVTSDVTSAEIADNTVSVHGIADIALSYKSPVKLSSINISTDMSNVLGKIARKITLKMPLDFAEDAHETLMKSLSKELPDGITLTVWDDDTDRIYEYSFNAYSIDELSELTKSVVNGKSNIDKNNSPAPFSSGIYSESIYVGKLVDGFNLASNNITVSYYLGNGEIIKAKKASDDFEKLSNNVTFEFDKDHLNISFEYRRLNAFRVIVYALAVAVIATLIVISVIIFKRPKIKPVNGIRFSEIGSVTVTPGSKPKINPTAPTSPAPPVADKTVMSADEELTPAPSLAKLKTTMKTGSASTVKESSVPTANTCKNCGNRIKDGEKFCSNCGKSVEK